ncbi:MAG TPA: ABC transporter ATP-binding protein [Acidimicrobiales bacterium]|nr:ABC transporter ATP-binding protein [Acidimicrobiales bacterium]
MTPVVELDRASKWFDDVVAVSEVSFSLGPGVTALLGPNGAGKSTVLRLVCGLASPSQGQVRIFGGDPRADHRLYRRVGLVPQQQALFDGMTALRFVSLTASLHGVTAPGATAAEALRVVELDPGDERGLETYSKGMRQRVKVAQALVHDPDLLVLDEPLDGLDPRQRARLIGLFRRLGEQGRCVLVSSHVLEEVERWGSRVLVLAQGRLVAEGDFHAIRDLMEDRPRRIRLRSDRPQALGAELLAAGAVAGVTVTGPDAVVVDTVDGAAFGRMVAPAARAAGARLLEVVPLDDDLESVFRYLVGR